MRCPNYTGFKSRLGRGADTAAEAAQASEGEGAPQRLGQGAGAAREVQKGIASWYGPGFHGRTTANGERFDMNQLTAAHKTLPFGTRVLVHNPRTGKQVVVRINDRGPFAPGRVIDLSKAAAHALGIKSRGHDAVVLREAPKGGTRDDLVASRAEGAGAGE